MGQGGKWHSQGLPTYDLSSQVERTGRQMWESLRMQRTHGSGQNSERTVFLGNMAKDCERRQCWRMGSPEPT